MFECAQCHKAFTRKDSLLRHRKTLHARSDVRDFSSNNDTSVTNQFENTTGHYLFDPLNKQAPNNVENKTLSIRDALSESDYRVDDSGRNAPDEDNSQVLQNNNESNIAESEEGLNPFDQRILAAAQAIQSKFDYLRSRHDIHETGSENNTVPTENEQKGILTVSDNHGGSTHIPTLTAVLQTALDILLIKELQNTSVEDGSEEENSNSRTGMKRPITFNSTEENENGELLAKHIKYNNSAEFGNNGQSKDAVRKYWHNPNTLVDELRHLIVNTRIGQQISNVIQSLEKNNNTQYFYINVEHEKQRKALAEELNGLKQTSVGHEIFSIIHELQKTDIIEPLADYLDDLGEEDASDYGENTTDYEEGKEDDDNTDDDK